MAALIAKTFVPHLVASLRSDVDVSTQSSASRHNLYGLPTSLQYALPFMGTIGLISFCSAIGLFIFATYRMIYWRRYYKEPVATQQIFMLIYNLLIADMHQALSFVIALHWYRKKAIVAPSSACFAQGWLIQVGDLSSGIWVLAIALHTFYGLVNRRIMSHRSFVVAVIAIWVFVLVLSLIGPLMYPQNFFVRAGAWCWINEEHEKMRLYLHYLWIFIAQFGSVICYSIIYIILRRRLKSVGIPAEPIKTARRPSACSRRHTISSVADWNAQSAIFSNTSAHATVRDSFAVSRTRVSRVARMMAVYPLAYVALTLPLAAGRVATMSGHSPPLVYYCVAGCLIACCGFVDVMLYVCTRKALVKRMVRWKDDSTASSRLDQTRKQPIGSKYAISGKDADLPSLVETDELDPLAQSALARRAERSKLGNKSSIGGIMTLKEIRLSTFTDSDANRLQHGILPSTNMVPGMQEDFTFRDPSGFLREEV